MRRGWVALVTGALLAVPALMAPSGLRAQTVGSSEPSSGTIGPASGSSTSWTFDAVVGAGEGGTPIETVCAPGQCSKYSLTVKLPDKDSDFYQHYTATLTYRCSWHQPQGDVDVDCFTFDPNGNEAGPGKPDANKADSFEELDITDPASGVWTLEADAGVTPYSTITTAVATLTIRPLDVPPAFVAQTGDPHFVNYDFRPSDQKTDRLNRPDAGEPSLGINPATGMVFYMAGNQVTRLDYSAGGSQPPSPTDVTPADSQVNEDAILFTDQTTHRTWALGLLLAGSYLAYTDNDGASWTPGAAFDPPAAPDHETFGSGPYHGTAPSGGYGRAVYYCAQTVVHDAYCGRSDDGGKTFNVPATPLFGTTCSPPIHGHVRVGPTGMVYVPNDGCTDANDQGRTGVAVSADNGKSFQVSMPPDSSSGSSDPSVMEGPDGLVYLGYQASSGHPMIAVGTHDDAGNITWRPSVDVGRFQDAGETEDGMPYGVQNTEFSEVVTGDAGRAAFAFLGTGTRGNDQAGTFDGTWYLFVSYTFDGGKTWRTVNATPNDPVQRGCVWNGGLVNACRNMLDFNDIGIDKTGHVYVAYTDGCTTSATYSCDKTPGIHGWNDVTSGDQTGCGPSEVGSVQSTSTCTFARLSAIVRQVCGRGLIASADPGFNESPDCAQAAGTTPLVVPAPAPATTPAISLPNTSSAAPPAVAGGLLVTAGLLAGIRRRRRGRA